MSVWIRTTRETLSAMGHTTFVVCPLSSDKMKESEPGIYPIGPIHILKSYPSYSVVGKPVETLRKIESIVRLEKPDVIHSNTPLTIGLGALHSSKIMNIPLIGSLHTLLPEMVKHYPPLRFKKLSEKLGWEIYYHYYDLCDQVTCPTLSIQKILCHRRIRKKIEIVSNGVNIQRFKPDMKAGKDIREFYGISQSGKILLFSGRLSFEKRISLLILAFKKLLRRIPDAYLFLLGDGPQRNHLEYLTRSLKIENRVYFLGERKHNDVFLPAMYNAADAFVLPSAFETQGLSMLEAMACGKTVIASNVGGVPDMITDNRDGFLVDFTDSERLNLCLESVLTDDEMRTIVGNAAVETARKYSIVLTTKKLLGIYDVSLTSRGRTVSTQSTDLLHIILYCLSFLSSYALFHILQRLDII